MNSLVKQREEKQDNSTSKGVVSNYYEFICELTITTFRGKGGDEDFRADTRRLGFADGATDWIGRRKSQGRRQRKARKVD